MSIGIFIIYKFTYNKNFNYVALGDSVAAGRNPYGVDDYGYTDYISDYLKSEGKLGSYVSYAVSGYKTHDIFEDISYNRKVEVNNKTENIRKSLRESDIVTISIGANDFLNGLSIGNISNILSNKDIAKKAIDDTINRIDDLLVLVKKYAKNTIIVVGYYNPLPLLTSYKESIDELVEYSNQKYREICNKNNVTYVEVSKIISTNNDFLPNPLDIHPSKEGYKVISEEVIKVLKNKVFK